MSIFRGVSEFGGKKNKSFNCMAISSTVEFAEPQQGSTQLQ